MSNTINADDGIISGIAGLKYSADTSGALVLQTNGTTAITISASQVVTFAGAVSLGALTTSGNLTFTGTGNRIIGDFTNATEASRVAFQSSTTNGSTVVNLLPNGTSVTSAIRIYNNSDPTNASFGQLVTASGTEIRLVSGISGTGTYLPMTFYTGGSERMRIDTSGNVGIGTSSPVTNSLTVSRAIGQGQLALLSNSTPTGNQRLFFIGAGSETDTGKARIGFETGEAWTAGTSTPTRIYFQTTPSGSTSNTTRMLIDASGNVGIGTSSPNFPVDVVANTNAAAVSIRGRSSDNLSFYQFTDNSTGNTQYGYILGGPSEMRFAQNGANYITSWTNGAERMRIDSSGNVGIGTNSPGARLDVAGNIRTTTYYNFNGNGSNPTDATAAVYDQAFVGPTISGASMSFRTGTPTPSERIRILSTGEVGIGTSSPTEKLTINGTASVNALFTTSGGMYFSNTMYMTASGATIANSIGIRLSESYGALWNCGNSTIWHHQIINGSSTVGFQSAGSNFGNGNILCTGTLTQNYSDVRLKTKVSGIENAVEKLCSIDTFVYVENDVAKSLGYTNTKNQLGVSAQSVQAVFPEVVSLAPVDIVGDPDTHEPISKSGENYLTVDYSRLVPALVAAIQELNAKVEALEAKLASKP